jgi:hypothetical protein
VIGRVVVGRLALIADIHGNTVASTDERALLRPHAERRLTPVRHRLGFAAVVVARA